MACTNTVTVNGPRLEFEGRNLFLNGINLAWVGYGTDTNISAGSGHGVATYCGWEEAIRFTVQNGGNSVRVWLFEKPSNVLAYSGNRVVGLSNGVLEMAQTLLEVAAMYNVFVVLVLFNGAQVLERDCHVFSDANVLQDLVENAIRPLAAKLQVYNSLAMWEVVNEPEAMLDINNLDTALKVPASVCPGEHDQAGWITSCKLSLEQLQRFVNRVAAGLRAEDSKHLITVGAWHFCTSTNGVRGSINIFSDEKLREAGGMADGVLDVHQARLVRRKRIWQ